MGKEHFNPADVDLVDVTEDNYRDTDDINTRPESLTGNIAYKDMTLDGLAKKWAEADHDGDSAIRDEMQDEVLRRFIEGHDNLNDDQKQHGIDLIQKKMADYSSKMYPNKSEATVEPPIEGSVEVVDTPIKEQLPSEEMPPAAEDSNEIEKEVEDSKPIAEAPVEEIGTPVKTPTKTGEPSVEGPPTTPEKNSAEQDGDTAKKLEGKYNETQENFAEALAKNRGIFGGAFGNAKKLEAARKDYVDASSEFLASKYSAKVKELEGKGDLSDEDINDLNADAIKNKNRQDFELNNQIKYQIENGNLFRKIFNSVDRLPKALRPLARMAGSNSFGILAWTGAAAVGLANPVVGVAIAAGTVAAFTRPGYGGSAFEAHKDVLSAASDEKDSVVVANGLARKKGESREDYYDRVDDMSQEFSEKDKVSRAIQGLYQKEGIQEDLENIKDPHDKDEMARVFAGMNDYTSKEQIELSNYDKNKNRITTGVLSVLSAALSLTPIPFSKIPGLHDGGWGKMAVGRSGGAADYSKIYEKLNPEEQPESTAVDSENVELNSEPNTNKPENMTTHEIDNELENIIRESGQKPSDILAEKLKARYRELIFEWNKRLSDSKSGPVEVAENAQPVEQQLGSSEAGQPVAPEIGNSEVGQSYSEDQYNQEVNRLKTLRKNRDDNGDGATYTSLGEFRRDSGVDAGAANDIFARMIREGVVDYSDVNSNRVR